jgi:hypothetical protein
MPKEVRSYLALPSLSLFTSSSASGKMLIISRIVNSSQVSSASDPPLSSDSILIKWRPVSAVSGTGSWEPSIGIGIRSHTILSIPAGGVLVSWLVSLLSDEIKGFIVEGLSSSPLYFFPSSLTIWLLVLVQIPCPPPISSTSLILPTHPRRLLLLLLEDSLSRILASRSPSLPTRPSQLGHFGSIFLECQTSACISSTRDYCSSLRSRAQERAVGEGIVGCGNSWKGERRGSSITWLRKENEGNELN